MSNLPITSRIKRSPLLSQEAGAIDPDNPKAIVGGISQEPDQTVTTLGKSEYNYTGPLDTSGNYYEKLAKEEGFKNFKGTIKEYEQSKLKKMSEAGNSNVEEEKGESSTTIVPGATTTWEGTLKKATTGDVMQPWEVRQMSRSIKKEQRDIRRSKIKANKFGSQNEKGEWVAKENLSPRQQAKFDEAKAEFKAFQAAATRNEAARGSGKKGGSIGVDTGQTNMLQGNLDKKEQETMLAEKAARDAGVITAKKEDETPKPAPPKMKPSAFKMYAKSPATKKLQGTQNKLPQHLQDAIKAAPGKMKSPMKKGYFKKY
jgi:hypothetical protein